MRLKEACVRASVRAILRPSIGRRGALGPRCLPPCCREYVCRFCSCPKQFTFFVTPLNLVDLLAILPFYISLILGQGKVRRPCAHATTPRCAFSRNRRQAHPNPNVADGPFRV